MQMLTSYFFRNSHVKFARRQANEVVHVLAQMTSSFTSFHNFSNAPTCIQNITTNKMN